MTLDLWCSFFGILYSEVIYDSVKELYLCQWLLKETDCVILCNWTQFYFHRQSRYSYYYEKARDNSNYMQVNYYLIDKFLF